MFLADRLPGDHDHILEDLLGEVPVFGRGAAADIGRREEGWRQYPGIIQKPFGAERINRCRNISTCAYPAKPTLLPPARQTFRSVRARNGERFGYIRYVDHVARCGEYFDELATALGQTRCIWHVREFAIIVNYCTHSILMSTATQHILTAYIRQKRE